MNKSLRVVVILLLAFAPLISLIQPVSGAPNLAGTPVLIAYDSFTRADGSIGSTETTGPASESLSAYAWTGGAISGNKNVITPSLGSELIVNGGFDTDSNWTKETGWAISAGKASITATTNSAIFQNVLTVNRWYQTTFSLDSVSSSGLAIRHGSSYSPFYTTSGTKTYISRATALTRSGLETATTSTPSATIDNYSSKELELNSLFSTLNSSLANVVVSANLSVSTGHSGLVINLDSASSPNNFVIAYRDGANIKLEKYVAGTYTALINTAVTYVAGATLRVEKDGTTYKVFYNGTQVGTDQTITDAGIINNTIHGLFSTSSSNSFDNFYLYDNNPATATPTATSTATATHTPTGTLPPTNTPTSTPTETPTPTATWAPVIFPTLNAEEYTLSSGNTVLIERRATFGEIGVMISLLCIAVPFGVLSFTTYLNRRR